MDSINLRNFKDFMLLYNATTETCFNRCVNNFNTRKLDKDELNCTESCAGKHLNFFNKIMSCYVDAQQDIVTKRIAEAQQAEAAQEAIQISSQSTTN